MIQPENESVTKLLNKVWGMKFQLTETYEENFPFSARILDGKVMGWKKHQQVFFSLFELFLALSLIFNCFWFFCSASIAKVKSQNFMGKALQVKSSFFAFYLARNKLWFVNVSQKKGWLKNDVRVWKLLRVFKTFSSFQCLNWY